MQLLEQHGVYFLMNRKRNGFYVNLPYNVIVGERTELTEKVREWLWNEKCPYILKEENEAEDFLDAISEELNEGYLDMSTDSDVDYFLQVTPNIIFYVNATDEYLGHGEYSMNASINGLIITDKVTEEEIKETVNIINKFE